MRTSMRLVAPVLALAAAVHCAGGATGARNDAGAGASSGGAASPGAASGLQGDQGSSAGSGAVGATAGNASGATTTGSGSTTATGDDGGSGAMSGSGGEGGTDASGAGSGSMAAPLSNCGTRSGMRGKTMRSVMAGGTSRTYIGYLPQSSSPTQAVPFVYVFHGFTMSGAQMFDITQYSSLADKEGIAVVFPDGQSGSPWNVSDNGAAVCGAGNVVNNMNAIDFAFMDAMMTDMLQDQCVDPKHVFATGFSMGGYFSHHVGCDRTDIHGVGPHSGGTIADLSGCKTGHMPVIIFHGTGDGLIADGCDDPTPNGTVQTGFPASATLWAKKNGCQNTYTMTQENGSGGGTGQCYLYSGCPSDGQVELCTFNGMSHGWAGGNNMGQGGSFAYPTYASATQLEWAFWKKYAW